MFVAHVENAMKSRGSTVGSTGEAIKYNYLHVFLVQLSGGCGVRVDYWRDARDWRQRFCGRAKHEAGETELLLFCLNLSHSFGDSVVSGPLSVVDPSTSSGQVLSLAITAVIPAVGARSGAGEVGSTPARRSHLGASETNRGGLSQRFGRAKYPSFRAERAKPTGHDPCGSEYRILYRHASIRTQAPYCGDSPGSGYFIDTPKSLARKAVTL